MPRLLKHSYHQWRHPATAPLRVPPQFLDILKITAACLDLGIVSIQDLERFLGLDNLADNELESDNQKNLDEDL